MVSKRNSRSRPGNCRQCGKAGTSRRPISKRGYCPTCGEARATQYARAMADRSGPAYSKWLEAMARVGAQAAQEIDS